MFQYNFKLALKGLHNRIGLTVLMIETIGIGIGLLMTMMTIGHQTTKIPLPGLSDKLYMVQMDSREIGAREITERRRMVNLTYKDALNLYEANTVASAQTFNFKVFPILAADERENTRPMQAMIDATTASFFSIFDAPFLYGKAWDKSENNAPVIVISKKTNDALFGGRNSVGQQLTVGTSKATVIGVLADWDIGKRVFDGSYSTNRFDDGFLPYQFALDINAQRSSRMRCHTNDIAEFMAYTTTDLTGLLNSECTWINFWAKIDNPADAQQYHQFTEQYVTEQKGYGRFPRAITNYVTNIDQQRAQYSARGWVQELNTLSYLFFFVCLVNAVGMLLTKFLSTAKEVCLRRALGAKKKIIMLQYLLEVMMIGLLGGLLGILVSIGGLNFMKHIRMYASDYTADMDVLNLVYRLDWSMVSLSIAVAIGSTVIVGLYPIWRVVNVSPASQLKGA